MSKANRKCKIDAKAYTYCLSCYADRNKPTWMSMFCCERCKNVFDALVNHTLKKATTEETKRILSGLDLSDLESFENEIKDQIKNVLSSNDVQENKEEVIVKEIVEDFNDKQKKISNKLK